jgi:hypothetical protein
VFFRKEIKDTAEKLKKTSDVLLLTMPYQTKPYFSVSQNGAVVPLHEQTQLAEGTVVVLKDY